MGTTLRANLSEKNPYWIERHRYYELRHYCMQYPIWKKGYASMEGLLKRPHDLVTFGKMKKSSNPTERVGLQKAYYAERIKMIEETARKASPDLSSYLIRGITEGRSYDFLKVNMGIPCCKDVYYEAYRKFFWLLDKIRD